MVTINNEDYLKQKLEWVEQRMEALDEIETRLREMRELAEYARDNDIDSAEAQELNERLQAMQQEVTELDEKTRVFWMDCQ
jgi:polyhydroxyalkanoate synthesis regulator phasin